MAIDLSHFTNEMNKKATSSNKIWQNILQFSLKSDNAQQKMLRFFLLQFKLVFFLLFWIAIVLVSRRCCLCEKQTVSTTNNNNFSEKKLKYIYNICAKKLKKNAIFFVADWLFYWWLSVWHFTFSMLTLRKCLWRSSDVFVFCFILSQTRVIKRYLVRCGRVHSLVHSFDTVSVTNIFFIKKYIAKSIKLKTSFCLLKRKSYYTTATDWTACNDK